MAGIQYGSDFANRNDRVCMLATLIGTAVTVALAIFVLGSALLTGVQTPAENQSVAFIDGHNQLPKIIRGVKFTDGCEVIAKLGDLQPQTAAA
jgi:hypothetical protein